jgi:hypothetical protein
MSIVGSVVVVVSVITAGCKCLFCVRLQLAHSHSYKVWLFGDLTLNSDGGKGHFLPKNVTSHPKVFSKLNLSSRCAG